MTLQLSPEELRSNIRCLSTCRLSKIGKPLSLVADSRGRLFRIRGFRKRTLSLLNRLTLSHTANLQHSVFLTHEILLALPEAVLAICKGQSSSITPLLTLSEADGSKDLINLVSKLQLRFSNRFSTERSQETLERLRVVSFWAGIPQTRGTLAEAVLALCTGPLAETVDRYLHPEGPKAVAIEPKVTPQKIEEAEEPPEPIPTIDPKEAVIATLQEQVELLQQELAKRPLITSEEETPIPTLEEKPVVEDTLHRVTSQTTLELQRIDRLITAMSHDEPTEDQEKLVPPLELARELGLQRDNKSFVSSPEDNLNTVQRLHKHVVELHRHFKDLHRSLKKTQSQLEEANERGAPGGPTHPGWASLSQDNQGKLETVIGKLELKNEQLKHKCEALKDEINKLRS